MAWTVYAAGTNTPAAGATVTVTLTHAVAAGDTVIAAASTGGAVGNTVSLVSDTQGNHYVLAGTTLAGQGMWIWYAQDAAPMTTSDSVTITFLNSADTKTVLVAGVNGAAATGVIADSYAAASGSSAAPSVTSAALGSSSEMALALFSNSNGGGSPSLAGGWTQAEQAHGSGQAYLTLAYQALNSSSAATASATITSTSWAAQILTLAAQGALPARWLQSVAGAPTANQFQVVTKLAGATSVRLKVGTNPGLTTGVFFVPAQVPDSYGYVRHTAANLAPATTYYYQAADTPSGGGESLLGPAGQCKTLPASGVPASFRFAVVSCVENQVTDDTAITDWNTWNPDLACFTGDQNYWDTQSVDLWTQVNLYELQIGNTGIGNGGGYPSSYSQMHGSHWGFYCRSDHEAGPDNGDSGPPGVVPWIPVNISAALEVFPWATLGDISGSDPPIGLWQAWTAGRVRFIMPDIRNTDRSPGLDPDGPDKTMLGAPQLAWFYNQLIQPEPLKIIVEDTQWPGPPLSGGGDIGQDKWWSYATERSAVISFMQANAAQVGNVLWIHGDSHLVGVLDGADDASWGGFPVFCAAPQNNVGGGLNTQVWDEFYDNSGGNCRLYGRITITDDGHTITVLQQGWDATAQAVRVSQSSVFTCPPAAPAVGGLGCAL